MNDYTKDVKLVKSKCLLNHTRESLGIQIVQVSSCPMSSANFAGQLGVVNDYIPCLFCIFPTVRLECSQRIGKT